MGSECPDRVYILADDLTGACDSGAAFLRTGNSVRVWLDSRNLLPTTASVQAFTTASRDLPPAEAAGAVYRLASALSDIPDALIFKKVDSALRGQVAAELLAANLALGTRAILLAPAFPATGRTVCGGLLRVQDAAGEYDPVCIRNLFPATMKDGIAEIESAEELAEAFQSRKTVLICDARVQEDLDSLVRAAHALPNHLYAGSAGLARSIASFYSSVATSVQLPQRARTLVICGTTHPVTELQLKAVERNSYRDVEILRIECGRRDASQIRSDFGSFHPRALVLTGGDTALLALRALEVQSLILQGEFAPGIPWGFAQGGMAEGKTVVTKSGGFGTSSALHDILTVLAGAE